MLKESFLKFVTDDVSKQKMLLMMLKEEIMYELKIKMM